MRMIHKHWHLNIRRGFVRVAIQTFKHSTSDPPWHIAKVYYLKKWSWSNLNDFFFLHISYTGSFYSNKYAYKYVQKITTPQIRVYPLHSAYNFKKIRKIFFSNVKRHSKNQCYNLNIVPLATHLSHLSHSNNIVYKV